MASGLSNCLVTSAADLPPPHTPTPTLTRTPYPFLLLETSLAAADTQGPPPYPFLQVYGRSWTDSGITGRKPPEGGVVPGSVAPDKGPDLLAWKPEQAIALFVPYGGLAQTGRVTKKTVPGGTMGRPLPSNRPLSPNSSTRF